MQKDDEDIFIGKYQLHEELGRGGYGTVYRAYDTVLKVERAVKVLHPALVTDPEFIERFKREAQLAAQLEHPHIVPVYDLGEDQGRFYLVMKYMPGGSLKDVLEKEERLDYERAVELTSQVADALDFAHKKDFIHRDVKPGNVLFDEDGRVCIADFGFAKALSGASVSLSASGGMVGTPAYMAPEVWEGKKATPATDVYSLACVFYEMVTGRVLFEGESPAELVRKHIIEGPQFPEIWPEGVSEGTSAVLGKALAADPLERFANLTKMIKALRILGDTEEVVPEPQVVRETEVVNQFDSIGRKDQVSEDLSEPRKKSIRKWLVALAVVVTAGLVLIGVGVGSFSDNRNTEELVYRTAKSLSTVLDATQIETVVGIESTTDVLAETPWPTITNTSIPPLTSTSDFSPTPEILTINDRTLSQVREIKRMGLGRIDDLKLSPDGSELVVAGTVGIWVYDVGSLTPNQLLKSEIDQSLTSVDWSPDGKFIVAGSRNGNIVIWDRDTGEIIKTFSESFDNVYNIDWTPDGDKIAFIDDPYGTGSKYSTAKVIDAQNGDVVWTLGGESSYAVSAIEWSLDGSLLAIGDVDGEIRIWDHNTGVLSGLFRGFKYHVSCISWSPDGLKIAAGSWDNTVGVWDINTGIMLHHFDGHQEPVESVAWSPSGDSLVSTSWDSTVKIWNIQNGSEEILLEGHNDWVNSVAWNTNNTLVTGSHDGTVRYWDTQSGENTLIIDNHVSSLSSLAWSPDSTLLASGGRDGRIRFWDVNREEVVHYVQGTGGVTSEAHVDWSQVNNTVAISNGGVRILDGYEFEQQKLLIDTGNPVINLSNDGKKIVIDNSVWDVLDSVKLNSYNCNSCDVSWSENDRWVVFSGTGSLWVYDVESGIISASLEASGDVTLDSQVITALVLGTPKSRFYDNDWSSNGQKIAGGGSFKESFGFIQVWEYPGWESLYRLEDKEILEIKSIDWHPKEELIAYGSRDGYIKIWDVFSNDVFILGQSVGIVTEVEWSPDGKYLASIGWDGIVRIWGIPNEYDGEMP